LVYRLPLKKLAADKSYADHCRSKPDERLRFRRDNPELIEVFRRKPIRADADAKSLGAPASSRAGLVPRTAREDAGAPIGLPFFLT